MKLLLILLIILSSCSTEKRCARINAKSERLGCLTHDTMYLPGEVKKGEKELFLDSAKLDSVAQVLVEHYQDLLDSCANAKDSNNSRKSDNLAKTKKNIKDLINKIPCKIEPTNDSTARFVLKIWVDSGKLKHSIEIKDMVIDTKCPKCPEPSWWHNFLEHFAIGMLTCIVFVFVIKKYT